MMKKQTTYQIRIEGHLSPIWEAEYENFTLTLEENGVTCLSGTVVDQAALHGLLRKVRDLGLPLISVTRLDARKAAQPYFHKEMIA
jgi:hypothetical protein